MAGWLPDDGLEEEPAGCELSLPLPSLDVVPFPAVLPCPLLPPCPPPPFRGTRAANEAEEPMMYMDLV